MNTILIKHGESVPSNGILLPFELGYSKNDNGLYIGLEDGSIKKINEIQIVDKVTKAEESDKANNDSKNQNIAETYIKDISIEGQNIILTKGDSSISTVEFQDNDTTYDIVTTEVDGLMSKEDKVKLDAISPGANKVDIDSFLSSTSTNPVQNKVIYEALQNTSGMSLLYDSNGFMGSPGIGEALIPIPGSGYQVLAIVVGSSFESCFTMIEQTYGITLYAYDSLNSTWCKRDFSFFEDYDDISGELTTFLHMGECIDVKGTDSYNTHLQLLKVYKVL